jgi:arginyl-tRNA synthetase
VPVRYTVPLMILTHALLNERLRAAIASAFGLHDVDPLMVAASDPKFGDFQCNAALHLAKSLQRSPREVAAGIVGALSVDDLCEPPTVAGPGFINLTLNLSSLEALLQPAVLDPRLGVDRAEVPRRVVIDFSSPNVAKDMHVGHLRSTILGDCIARILEFQGHNVIRLNHLGDWGTQFGMLITYLAEVFPAALTTADALGTDDLVGLYRQAKARFDADEGFRDASRQAVVRLQAGEPAETHAWQLLVEQSRRSFDQIYRLLDIRLTERGESFYNSMLPAVASDLEAAALLTESDGAACVFPDGFTNREGQPMPLIVRKSDGGYNYATTDLAAVRHRVEEEHADWLIYVTDAGQSSHFAQVFAVARQAGWVPEGVELTHVPFGLVLGEDGKRLRTRAGENVRLRDLLEEAVLCARTDLVARLAEEGRDEEDTFLSRVAQVMGLGAVKYADLSHNRMSDYVFNFDKMLALHGNTAPYLIYAYVRVQGISRKAQEKMEEGDSGVAIILQDEAEIILAKHLVRLDEVLAIVADEFLPNHLCQYLFELSQKFNVFYERCPVLTAEPAQRQSRRTLCDMVAQTLKLGLSLLGIGVLDRL